MPEKCTRSELIRFLRLLAIRLTPEEARLDALAIDSTLAPTRVLADLARRLRRPPEQLGDLGDLLDPEAAHALEAWHGGEQDPDDLERLAQHLEGSPELRRQLHRSAHWLLMMTLGLVGGIGGLLVSFAPTFASIYQSMHLELPQLTQWILWLGLGLGEPRNAGLLLLGLRKLWNLRKTPAASILGGVGFRLARWLPFLGRTLEGVVQLGILESLVLLTAQGVSTPEALATMRASRSTGSPEAALLAQLELAYQGADPGPLGWLAPIPEMAREGKDYREFRRGLERILDLVRLHTARSARLADITLQVTLVVSFGLCLGIMVLSLLLPTFHCCCCLVD